MRRLLHRLQFEYDQGGIRHVLEGGVEKLFIDAMRPYDPLYEKIAPRYFQWRSSNDILQYDHPPDPFKVKYVDLDRIVERSGRPWPEDLNRRKLFGKVLDGNWDIPEKRIEDEPIYQAAVERFVDGKQWEETEYFSERISRMNHGEHTPWLYESRDDLLSRLNQFEGLYNRIEEEGYRTQAELIDQTGETTGGLYPEGSDEVAVDIGRDGQLLYADGTHRLAIAKLLDLDAIPVVFFVRHAQWMEHRDAVFNRDLDTSDHPDLRE